ncbi:MAG: cyclic lactone autoinducer peptide [Lachnospiraceae bacterium]|nr:cyclic lactone autoinducer peptide [Lachnospiraceae bacterium]
MKKNLEEKGILNMITKVLEVEVKKNAIIWPPLCGGFVHQPKRPLKNKDK